MKKWKKPWLIELILCAAVFLAVAASRGVFTAQTPAVIYSGLCDAFFVPGVFLFSFGLLAFCAYGGIFDIFSYGLKSLKILFTPFGKPEKHQKYYEYKLMKEASRQRPKPWMLLIGTGMMLCAGLCLILYNGAA